MLKSIRNFFQEFKVSASPDESISSLHWQNKPWFEALLSGVVFFLIGVITILALIALQ